MISTVVPLDLPAEASFMLSQWPQLFAVNPNFAPDFRARAPSNFESRIAPIIKPTCSQPNQSMLDAFVPLDLPGESLVMEILNPWLIVVFPNFVDDYRAVFRSNFKSKMAPKSTQVCSPRLEYDRHVHALGFVRGSFDRAIAMAVLVSRNFRISPT